ncbi:MAG: enoyl-CoA hydratase/isomerase family protein [Actinomycetota bacterium]
MSFAFKTLDVRREGPVGWLNFNRPENMNAMDAGRLAELEEAWKVLDSDPAVRVIVNGAIGPVFNTGLDVKELSKNREALKEQSRRTRDATLKLTAWHVGVWKPVIVAVNGLCAGGGLHFVADADIVVMSPDAQLLDPHVSVGQVSAFETITLARKVPMEAVSRMALVGRGERINAQTSYRLGLCSQISVSVGSLHDECQVLAETIARNSPAALAASKRALWGAFEDGLTDACRKGSAELVSVWGHPDQTEGPSAYAEGRNPEWRT